jgi:hypothetical protein
MTGLEGPRPPLIWTLGDRAVEWAVLRAMLLSLGNVRRIERYARFRYISTPELRKLLP